MKGKAPAIAVAVAVVALCGTTAVVAIMRLVKAVDPGTLTAVSFHAGQNGSDFLFWHRAGFTTRHELKPGGLWGPIREVATHDGFVVDSRSGILKVPPYPGASWYHVVDPDSQWPVRIFDSHGSVLWWHIKDGWTEKHKDTIAFVQGPTSLLEVKNDGHIIDISTGKLWFITKRRIFNNTLTDFDEQSGKFAFVDEHYQSAFIFDTKNRTVTKIQSINGDVGSVGMPEYLPELGQFRTQVKDKAVLEDGRTFIFVDKIGVAAPENYVNLGSGTSYAAVSMWGTKGYGLIEEVDTRVAKITKRGF